MRGSRRGIGRQCSSPLTPVQGKTYLAGTALAMQLPADSRLRLLRGIGLHIQPGILGQVCRQQRQHLCPQAVGKRRIDKGNVKALAWRARQPGQRIAGFHPGIGLQTAGHGTDGGGQLAILLHQGGLGGAARERFQPECATARQ